MNTIRRADYIGFYFNGYHSSELGIVRVSDGSRFNENLLPTIQDKTVQIPGGDGMYYFGSYYTQKQFNVSYAFDALTEEKLALMKRVFGDKKIHDLTFDEAPYKTYQAKVTGTASIKYIPFAEGETNRIYKGEGTIQFTAYNPFATCKRKYLSDYSECSNQLEWKGVSGLLESQGYFDRLTENKEIYLYNPGDMATDFILTLDFNASKELAPGFIRVGEGVIELEKIISEDQDDSVKINSKLNLIEGYAKGRKSGNIYNKHIKSGSFFKIPVSREKDDPLQLEIDESLKPFFKNIQYDYIYF